MTDQLDDVYGAVEHDRQEILRTMRAVDGMSEETRLDLIGEWLRRARTHWRLQNADLYRLNARKACAMLVCGLLRVGEPSDRRNEDADRQGTEGADDLSSECQDRDV
jgi:hypothetical protein